ncbi:MAG TPA: ACT domain-containing protein [Acidimicrobiales bacterium]|nr:ACT domain-containing protein [Acidimicrobiales bacterium]
MADFAVTAVGADRPGIVASVTGPLVELGCNLEDTAMTILRGRFAMVMIVSGPDALRAEAIAEALAPVAEGMGLDVWAHAAAGPAQVGGEGDTWTVSVHGADRPGIVHAVADLLAGAGANITDLVTRVVGPEDAPVYTMVMEVELAPGSDGAALSERLHRRAGELGVAATMHPASSDIL